MQPLFGSPPKAAAPVKEVTTATFRTEVMEASRDAVILVDFWGSLVRSLQNFGPILERVAAATKGAVRLVKINIDENQQLAAQLRVQSIPTVYAFYDARPVDAFQGALPESQVKEWVKRLATLAVENDPGAQIAELIEDAKLAFGSGDSKKATTLYRQILQADPENIEAIAGLGRIAVQANQLGVAKQTLAQVPKDKLNHPDALALKSAIDLAEETASLGQRSDLEARLAQNEEDHAARYDLAMRLYAEGDKQGAVDRLLEIVRLDRAWNEEAARKQLLKLLEAFGFSDPISVATRRRLSSLLFK